MVFGRRRQRAEPAPSSRAWKAWLRLAYVLVNTPLFLAPSAAEEQPPRAATTSAPRSRRTAVSRMSKAELLELVQGLGYSLAEVMDLGTDQLREILKREKETASNSHLAGAYRMNKEELSALCYDMGIQASGLTCAQMRNRLRGWQPPEPPARSAASSSGLPRGSAAHAAATAAMLPTGAAETTSPTCPACRRSMVLKRNSRKTGDQAWFWGCQSYPSCRQTFEYQVPPDTRPRPGDLPGDEWAVPMEEDRMSMSNMLRLDVLAPEQCAKVMAALEEA